MNIDGAAELSEAIKLMSKRYRSAVTLQTSTRPATILLNRRQDSMRIEACGAGRVLR